MKTLHFSILNPRFANADRDQNRVTSLLVDLSGAPLVVSGFSLSGIGAAAVAIVDASGQQITSFGSGTQYTDGGAAATHPIGTGIIFNAGGTYEFVSTSQPLPITIISGNPTSIAVTQSTSPWVVSNGGTFAVQASIAAAQTLATVTNVSQINGISPTYNSTTTSAKQAMDHNIISILGTAPTTAGFLDIKGADGNVFVRQTTGTNLHTVIDSGTITAVTAISNALPAGTNNIGDVNLLPGSNTGWSFSYQSALSSTKVQIKGTAGTFGGYINLFNPNTATTFIQVFNKASASVTVGSTTPDFVITLPGIATASGTGSDRNLEITMGVAMSTGITIAATTTATGSTAPSNAVVGTFLFI